MIRLIGGAKLLTRNQLGSLVLASAVLFGCSEMSIAARQQAQTEQASKAAGNSPLERGQSGDGMALLSVETIAMTRHTFEAIMQFDPYHGLARLGDGRCVQLRQEPNEGSAAIAMAVAPTDTCIQALPLQGGYSLPCDGESLSPYVGDWRMRCVRLRDGKSALVAIGARAENSGREITLAVVDQEVRLFKVFKIHPGIADVTTLGWRDGKAAISSFSWIGNSTGKDRRPHAH